MGKPFSRTYPKELENTRCVSYGKYQNLVKVVHKKLGDYGTDGGISLVCLFHDFQQQINNIDFFVQRVSTGRGLAHTEREYYNIVNSPVQYFVERNAENRFIQVIKSYLKQHNTIMDHMVYSGIYLSVSLRENNLQNHVRNAKIKKSLYDIVRHEGLFNNPKIKYKTDENNSTTYISLDDPYTKNVLCEQIEQILFLRALGE